MNSHQNCVTFTGVIRANLHTLKNFTGRHEYARGQAVYCVGDPADELFLVADGRVKIMRVSPEGQQKILDIYRKGDLFGELCICGGHARTEQAIALEPLVVTSFQMQGLLNLLRRQPETIMELLQVICARLGEAHDQIATLAFENIPRRLAREILRLSRTPEAKLDGQSVHLDVNLSHEELAQLVGTSREMVTTVMKQFRRRGLLDYSRRHIVVRPKRMEEFLTKTQP